MANQTDLLNVSDEMKLDDMRQELCGSECGEELCSSSSDTTEELYSSSEPDTCGDGLPSVEKSPINQSLHDIWKERRWLYLFPQEGQKRLLQRKGTNLRLPQLGQPYMAPP